jgi:predicted metal-dependent phosphoesterase TrpH
MNMGMRKTITGRSRPSLRDGEGRAGGPAPLLCELHSHSTWSDGQLSLAALVDLYGRHGFDVLCVTDHVLRSDDPWHPARSGRAAYVGAHNFDHYLEEIEIEAARARAHYDLLVVPGLELTYDDPDPARSAHAVAVGLRTFVELERGLEQALEEARGAGAALIAAHPYSLEQIASAPRATARWQAEWRALAPRVDRFELVNRTDVFGWVANAGLPAVASGDFHVPAHLPTWKTLLACARSEEAVVAHLRSQRPAYLVDARELVEGLLVAA